MNYVIYTLAAIGAVVTGGAVSLFLAWSFVRLVAKAQLKRLARAAALTPTPNQ